ncbi:MAG: hypothetical protein AAF525_11415 [Pseudomonadota bacterium]
MPSLNLETTNNLIKAKSLQRWWIAEQLNIDRRTLHRWLTGKTANIPQHQVTALSRLLDCSPETLTILNEQRTADDAQIKAVHALLSPGLLEDLTPSHRFEEFQALAQGLSVPGLSQNECAQLNHRMAIALLRQSKLVELPMYALRARELALLTGDNTLALKTQMLLSYSKYLAGHVRTCLQMDVQNLREARRLKDPWQTAANLSNLADQFCDFGCFDRSLRLQKRAIRGYESLDASTSLVFCWLGVAGCFLAIDKTEEAKNACTQAGAHSRSVNFKRGFADEQRLRAQIEVRSGNVSTAAQLIDDAMVRYRKLNIEEAQILADASLVWRKAGDAKKARCFAEQGLRLARERHHVIAEARLALALAEIDPCPEDIRLQGNHAAQQLNAAGHGTWVERCHPAFFGDNI